MYGRVGVESLVDGTKSARSEDYLVPKNGQSIRQQRTKRDIHPDGSITGSKRELGALRWAQGEACAKLISVLSSHLNSPETQAVTKKRSARERSGIYARVRYQMKLKKNMQECKRVAEFV